MQTVIFRPTNSCNLSCTYCYDKNNHNVGEKEIRTTATQIFRKEENDILKSLSILYKDEEHPRIIFHGGEPLLVSTSVLNEFCRRLSQIGDVKYSIQTNGTLINDEVIDFFKEHNFSVGISLDGCNERQNQARVYPSGKNSFGTVLRNINKLQENDVKFGVIMSITKAHKDCEKQLYDFIGEKKLSCNVRPVFASDVNDTSHVMSVEEYANFFSNLFDIWYDDSTKSVGTHQILEIYNALRKEIDPNFIERTCSLSDHCFRDFISMDVLSNLYACNRLYGIKEFYYGNLKYDNIELIYNKIEKLIKQRNSSIQTTCGDCENLRSCNGGCPAESYDLYGDISHPTNDCKVKKLVSNHIKERL